MKLKTSNPLSNNEQLPQIDRQFLEDFTRKLSHPRPFGNNEKAKQLIRSVLDEACQKENHGFNSHYTDPFGNIVAGNPKTAKYLIGAHYDSCEETPGADDNASAVAVMLAVAKECKNKDYCFVAFDAEELNLSGSEYFCNSLKDTQLQHAHILEMVGFTSPKQQNPIPLLECPAVGDFLGLVCNDEQELDRVLNTANSSPTPFVGIHLANEMMPIAKQYSPQVFRSDHTSFWRTGIPATMWTDTAEYRNPNYHQPTDTPDTLDYNFMERVAQVLLALTNAS